MATTSIRRLGVFSVGKVMGLTYALLGLIFGAIFALISVLGGAFGAALGEDAGGAFAGALFGVGSVIILPILYGLIGFIGGLLTAAIYNFVAGFTGGVELELSAPAPGPVPMATPGYGGYGAPAP